MQTPYKIGSHERCRDRDWGILMSPHDLALLTLKVRNSDHHNKASLARWFVPGIPVFIFQNLELKVATVPSWHFVWVLGLCAPVWAHCFVVIAIPLSCLLSVCVLVTLNRCILLQNCGIFCFDI